jgi:nucleotide-binding universal stress UspA family protein
MTKKPQNFQEAPMSSHASSSSSRFRIVVGIDFSAGSDLAFDRAMHIAHHVTEADIFLVHVVDDHVAGIRSSEELAEVANLFGSMPERLGEYAKARASTAGLVDDLTMEITVRSGSAARAIAKYAREVNADVIIVGGSTDGIQTLLLGSVAELLLSTADRPVMVARPEDAFRNQGADPVPPIEPPCPACIATRVRTRNEQMWCEVHAKHRVMPHAYGYEESNPYATRDANVTP